LVMGLANGCVAASAQADALGAPDFWPSPTGVLEDMGRMVQNPTTWDETAWLWAGAVGLGTVALHQYDGQIRTWIRSHDGTPQNDVARFGNALGDGLNLVPLIGLGYVGGWLLEDKTVMGDALAAAEAYLGSGVVTVALKSMTGRARPYTGQGPNRWHGPFQTGSDVTSFPSGHATSVVAIASALATRHPDTWVGPIAYSLAATTLYARMHHDKHWASDLLPAVAIGYWTGRVAGEQSSSSQALSWQVAPLPGGGEAVVIWRW